MKAVRLGLPKDLVAECESSGSSDMIHVKY